MTIITSAELNNYATNRMDELQDDKAMLTRSYQTAFQFISVGSSTPLASRQKRFVVPRTCFVETVFAYGDNGATSKTIDVTVEGDGALVNWPIELQDTFLNASNFNRTWFNNASTKYRDRGFRVFPQGSTITITVAYDAPSTVTILTVGFVFRQFYGR